MNVLKKINLNISRLLILLILTLTINGCSSLTSNERLFDQLGGQAGIELLTEKFIEEIQYDKDVMPYFLKTDVNRFRQKFVEQICMLSDGPCQYTGDSMEEVHSGMEINERHFNAIVNNLTIAMESINLPITTQNRLLNLLAPMRKQIIYR
jgi:hemoglobin